MNSVIYEIRIPSTSMTNQKKRRVCGSGVVTVPDLPLFSGLYQTRDGDPAVRALADRHYSRKKPGAALFVGPGRSIVLRNADGTEAFIWRLSKYRDDGQEGWECTLFRNEGPRRSSDIILEAERFLYERYGPTRVFTYVNQNKIRKKRDPGRCFRRAGWVYDGTSKGNLIRLAKQLERANL